MPNYTSEDYPVEDMFGTEVRTGDKWFQDNIGRIINIENIERYLTEISGVEIFKAM